MSDEEAQKHYLDGMKLFGEQKHAAGIEAFRRALEAKPQWT